MPVWPVNLNLRHADISRTWTEIGWLEWSVIPFIGAFVFIRYDKGVTPILMDAIQDPIGDYIAQEIVVRINNTGRYARMQNAGVPAVLVQAPPGSM